MRLDSEYYIMKNIIPPLQRFFGLISGVNLQNWYFEMPKLILSGNLITRKNNYAGGGISTINLFAQNHKCTHCGKSIKDGDIICAICKLDPVLGITESYRFKREKQAKRAELTIICSGCTHASSRLAQKCTARDCNIYYQRLRTETLEW